MKFWHLVRVVRSRILMILGVVLVTLLVILVAVPKPTVLYPATALVSPTAQVMSGGISTTNTDQTGRLPDRNVILSNLIILAQGGEVFQRALDFLALPVTEQRTQCPGLRQYQQVSRIEVRPGELLTVREWPDVLEVTPVQMPTVGEKGTTTDIIRITVKLRDGSLAPFLANAVAYAFMQVYQEKSREDTRKYIKFLEASLEETKSRLQDLQQRVANYKSSRGVLEVDAETQAAISSLASLEAARDTAHAALLEAESALRDIDGQLARQPLVSRDSLPADMNPEVQKLKSELAQAEAELRLVEQRYKPGHDTYKAVAGRVAGLKERIAREGANYAPPSLNAIRQELLKRRSDATVQVATARAKYRSISSSLAQAQAKAQNLSHAQPGLALLIRDQSDADNKYKMLSDRLAQAQVAEQEFTKTGSVIPYNWAWEAGKEITEGPTRKALLLYGFVLSLLVGIAVSVWLDSIDTRMRNAADVENLLSLPVMGLTPQITSRDGVLPKLTHIYPLSASAEAYRILRTNILFALRDNPFKTLMVATGRPGQGGTTTICNLAIALAQIGKRIILIDADMRRPSLHRFFGVDNSTGLSTLLQGASKVTDVFRKTEVENLIVIPGGPQPINPSELLGSDRMREIVEMLQEHCDLVLFDTPSTVVFSDGPMLASWIDAVIMVVSANQTPRGTEVQTRDLLRRARANILGVVVNRMAQENVDSCYFYSQYYADSAVDRGPVSALGSGNGSAKTDGSHERSQSTGARKAIPAPAAVGTESGGQSDDASSAGEDEAEANPFPD